MAVSACKIVALPWLFHVWLPVWAVLLFIYGPMFSTFAEEVRPNTHLGNHTEHGICKSVDIRNTIDTFRSLQGCRVVEGFVQILLFDSVNKSSFENISFPELREITDYLLLYRVNGLLSLGQLFPNLSVIRGQTLLFGFAFIVFEMSSLQEINLYSLTDITQGLIRIDKNPSLCFVNSIDWSRIYHEKGDHFIRSLKPENECPLCPGDDGFSVKTCPAAVHIPGVNDHMEGRHLCWNRDNCQKICPSGCNACDEERKCCDKCLGGCSVANSSLCDVCEKFAIVVGNKTKCTDNCPPGLYEYLGRRCVTKEQCVNFTKTDERNVQHEFPYKVFERKCIPTCPPNYMDDYVNRTCIRCDGKCKKKCPTTKVDNLASARQLFGCTHINGSLEIQIRGGRNIVNELEENLKMIEEIDGYIKILRSFPLMSLNFLKNLKVIHGNTLEYQKYVFVVLDNQNLQDIWDWTNRTLKIGRGKLFFHFNPKLCIEKIKRLKEAANLDDFTDLDVATNSNGDKTACNVQDLIVNIQIRKSIAVSLSWEVFKMHDPRKLLAYLIYSIEAPHKNVSLYDNRDACGGDGWRVNDVQIPDDNSTKVTYLLPNLKPYTQYAFYVKTYTIATERSGAQSKITYFWTKPDKPNLPGNVQVSSNSSDALLIKWSPPNTPNGNITFYSVTGFVHRSDLASEERNYCNSTIASKQITTPLDVPHTISKPRINDTCECADGSKETSSKLREESERVSQISFEDELLNRVYVKKGVVETNRKKRQLFQGGVGQEEHVNTTGKNITIGNITSNSTQTFETFNFTVMGNTELYITKLHHFTVYSLSIQACRCKEKDDEEDDCSEPYLKQARTKKKVDADNILSGVNITHQNLSSITLTWDEPTDPNGKILTYQIEYKRVDIANSMPTPQCDNAHTFLKNGKQYAISNLNPGNYSIRVKAVSSAGDGDFTPYVYVYVKDHSSSSTQIVLYVIVVFVIFGIVVTYFVKKKCDANSENKLIKIVNPEYVVYVPDEWEVERSKIELREELGQGSFGMVYEGIARDVKGKSQMKCAIKTVNIHATDRERVEFLNEASVMKAFDTTHVVKLLGVVSKGQPTLVVMELMAKGDLKSYLRSHRPGSARQPPTLKNILQMAIEISDGMAYLAAKKFVHRDLAARNCMVAEDLIVKIGDFGMTRDIYETDYYRKGTKGLLPVRWMAPESLKDGVFTSSSDVWSYGIVLWEMITLASQPYQGLSNDQVLRYVIDGGIMERPDNCPDKLYMLMRCCWKLKPLERPTFLELCALLLEDASPNFSKVSFYHSTAGMEARSSKNNQSTSQDDDPSTPLRIAHERKDFYLLKEDYCSDVESEADDDLESDIHIEFSSYPVTKNSSTTINGYLGTNPSNGTMAK